MKAYLWLLMLAAAGSAARADNPTTAAAANAGPVTNATVAANITAATSPAAVQATAVAANTTAAANPDPPFTDEYLEEIIRNLYRWEMDETMALGVNGNGNITIWTRNLDVKLDDQDASRYREIFFPQLQLDVVVKKADYLIPEFGQRVQNRDYMIERVERLAEPEGPPGDYAQRTLSVPEVMDYLKRTRSQLKYPEGPLLDRLRLALRDARKEYSNQPPEGPQTIYVAPLSPVKNTLLLFWENYGWLIKFSSDSDLNNPLFWDMEKLEVRVYDLHQNVVVTLGEVNGSHAYVTRDWAARAVFNCMVFGERLQVTASGKAEVPATYHVAPHAPGGR